MVQAEYLKDVPSQIDIAAMDRNEQLRLFNEKMRYVFPFSKTPEELVYIEVGGQVVNSRLRSGHEVGGESVFFDKQQLLRSGLVTIVGKGPLMAVLSQETQMYGETFTVVEHPQNQGILVAFLDPVK